MFSAWISVAPPPDEGRRERLPPERAVTGEVLARDQAAAAAHLGEDQVGREAAIELLASTLRDSLQGAREIRLPQNVSALPRAIRAHEHIGARRKPGEPSPETDQLPRAGRVQNVPAGQRNGRRDHLAPR
jgi:hypothetical protein